MATLDEPSSALSLGLGRAPLDTYAVLDNHNQQNGQATVDALSPKDDSQGTNKLQRLSKRLRVKLSGKTEESPDAQNDQRFFDSKTLAPTLAPGPEASNQNDRFSGDLPDKPTLLPIKDLTTHPIDTIKSIGHSKGGTDFAENVANTEISHGASVNLVLAHEKIEASTNDQDRMEATQGFELLKKDRQDSLVRWTMDRHVRKVKNVQAQSIPRADKQEFMRVVDGRQKMQWLDYASILCDVQQDLIDGVQLLTFHLEQYGSRYIGASSELPEPTESALISSFERVLLTSVPVQDLVMELSSIACWESPMKTAGYAVLYFTLCMFTKVISTVILFAILSTLKARFYPPTIADLRDKLERSEDTERTPQDLIELIEQHGARGWVGAFIKKAGPTLQLQLEDLADFMEVLTNFQGWRDPRRTKRTLILLCSLWLAVAALPTWLLVKGIFFGMGIAFFVITPISHRWPPYRLLVSPGTWLMWEIPTHAEWAIARLQAEATQHLNNASPAASNVTTKGPPVIEQNSAGSMRDPETKKDTAEQGSVARKDPIRLGRYHCTYEKVHGNLSLDTEGIYFELHLTAKEKWRLRYTDLKSVQKIVGSSMISSGQDILFVDMQDTQYRVSALKLREEVFTQVIGYSGIEWRVTG